MSQDLYYDEDEVRIRKQIERRYKARQGLWIHFTAFFLINLMLWMIWAFATPTQIIKTIGDVTIGQTSSGEFPWPLIVTLSWGIGMVSHFLGYYNKYGGGAQRREDAIQREIERYRERSAYEKPKNDFDSRLDVTDDGELQEIYEDESTGRRKRG